MEKLLILVCLCLCCDLNWGQYNYRGKVPHESLSQTQCVLAVNGKKIVSQLKTALVGITKLKEAFEFKLFPQKTEDYRLSTPIVPEDILQPVWGLGRLPAGLRAPVKQIQHLCSSLGGILPSPASSSDSQASFSALLKKFNLTSQIIDARWASERLIYSNGVTASTFKSFENIPVIHPETMKTVIGRIDAIYALEPVTAAILPVEKSKWDSEVGAICMLPINQIYHSVLNPATSDATSKKIIKRLTMLHDITDKYLDKLKLTPLDVSENKEGGTESFPVVLGDIQETISVIKSCFHAHQCSLTNNDILNKLEIMIDKFGHAITQIDLGFLITGEGTCQISNALKLSCLCTDEDEKWFKLSFDPVPVSNQMLSFTHIIYRMEGNQPSSETCFYHLDDHYYMLTSECCKKILASDETALSDCPNVNLRGHSPVTLNSRLLRVDSTDPITVNRKCDLIHDSKSVSGGDSLMLTSCDLELVSNLGNYVWKMLGNLFVEKPLGDMKETLSTKDLAIFGSLGALTFLLLILLSGIIFFCSKNSKVCSCCVKRKEKFLEPLQLAENMPLSSYELRSLELKPSFMQQN